MTFNVADVRLSGLIAPCFKELHREIKSGENYDSFWLKGGRGSTKSSFIALQIILDMMRDKDANAIVFRKVSNTVRHSVLPTLLWAIGKLELNDYFRRTISPTEIIFLPTNQKIIMKGLDEPLKLKSIKADKGYLKHLWFEEIAEFAGMDEIRNVRQSVMRGGASFIEFASYNPPNDPQAWVNKEVLNDYPRRLVHTSSYLDVPPDWLGEKFISDANWLKENNPLAYAHEYMGEAVGRNDAIIFAGKYAVREFEPQPHWHGAYYGADWGFANDPNTLVRCFIEDIEGDRRRLYIEYAEFGNRVEIDDIPEMWLKVPESKRHRVYADSARPETISHLRKRGFDVVAAEKWGGSVEDGIEVIKSFAEIVIHPRCVEMQEEARLYSYKIDRLTGDILPVIVDKFNHGWDAVRYALSKYIKPRSMPQVRRL